MINPVRIGHVVLNVRNMAASEKFYTEVLGFEVATRRPKIPGVFLTCGKIHHDLALFEVPATAPGKAAQQVGINHMAIQLADTDALKEAYHWLNQKNVPIDRMTDHGMTASLYFSDPDGNGLELFCNTCEDGLEHFRTRTEPATALAIEDL